MLRDAVHKALQCMHSERQAFLPESTVYFFSLRLEYSPELGRSDQIIFMKIDIFRSKYIDTLL